MPRKDPVTGCMVMTTTEFWEAEANHEGKGREPHELMEDFWQDMADDTERCRKRLLEPKNALDIIRSNMDEIDEVVAEEDQYTLRVIRVIRVVDATMTQNLRDSNEGFLTVVDTTAGRKLCRYSSFHDSGTMIDPPYGESYVDFEDFPFDAVAEDRSAGLLWLSAVVLPVLVVLIGLL